MALKKAITVIGQECITSVSLYFTLEKLSELYFGLVGKGCV